MLEVDSKHGGVVEQSRMKRKRFSGELALGASRVDVKFSVSVSMKGEAKIVVDKIAYDRSSLFIDEAFYEQAEVLHYFDFSLNGRARDGTTFQSALVHVYAPGISTTDTGPTTIRPVVGCSECHIEFAAEPGARTGVQELLRGFRSFQPIVANCPLGKIELRGPVDLKPSEKGRLTGALVIEGPPEGTDLEAWRTQVAGLFKHLRSIMSFARGAPLVAPVVEAVLGGKIVMTIRARMDEAGHSMGAFTPFNYSSIFRQAVASYFFEESRRKKIAVAIEWFTMTAGYCEAQLTSAMTVLENLLTANLTPQELAIRPTNQFKKLRSRIVDAARHKLTELGVEGDALEEEVATIREKVGDINRRPLRAKIDLLAKKWGVPMDAISDEELGAAKRARDQIVHQGQYTRGEHDQDLMRHVRLTRELVIRFILAALEFDGTYTSPLTGERDRVFRLAPVSKQAIEM